MSARVSLEELGVLTRADCLAAHMTDDAIAWKVISGRWQRVHHGVYVTRVGPLGWLTRASAALVACGSGAALRGTSAAFVHDLEDKPGDRIEILVPARRRVIAAAGVDLRHSDLPRVAGTSWPPRTSVESTLVELAARGSEDDSIATLARALQARRTTPQRLGTEIARYRVHPYRRLLTDVLHDLGQGAESTLEVRFGRDVERRHGLPRGVRQAPASGTPGRRFDIAYEDFATIVELDGAIYHIGQARAIDRRKSNAATLLGNSVLRYGWTDVAVTYCDSAVQLAQMLWAHGWRDKPQACGPQCAVIPLLRARSA